MGKMYCVTGGYSVAGNSALNFFALDESAGTMTFLKGSDKAVNPSYFVFSGDGETLYTVREEKIDTARVCSFKMDWENLALIPISEQPSHGGLPCHVAINGDNTVLFAANYGSGTVCSYPLKGGVIGEAVSINTPDMHKRFLGLDPAVDTRPGRGHFVCFDRAEGLLYSCDLGLDTVFVSRVESGKLSLTDAIAFPRGSGPRHLAMDPEGKYFYVITELSKEVYAIDKASGEILASCSTLPGGYEGKASGAAIRVSNGLIYASTRFHDSIAAIRFDREAGTLAVRSILPALGHVPRDFNITPDGKIMVIANQGGANTEGGVVVCALENDLYAKKQAFALSRQCCVAFVSK